MRFLLHYAITSSFNGEPKAAAFCVFQNTVAFGLPLNDHPAIEYFSTKLAITNSVTVPTTIAITYQLSLPD